MKISPELAQNIVDTLKSTLDQKVNLMDKNGLVIASTNKNRINTFHEGALKVIETKQTLFVESEDQFKGAKIGYNMPIFFESDVIGVIGVTGDQKVEKFVQLVKTMTEILIKEAYLNERSFQMREKNRLIIESLLLDSQDMVYDLFDLDFSNTYRVIVGSYNPEQVGYITDEFTNHFNYFTFLPNYFVILATENQNIKEKLEVIQKSIFEDRQIELKFGIGVKAKEKKLIKKSYDTAVATYKWIESQKDLGAIAYFEHIDLGILLCDLEDEKKELYQSRVFKKLSEKDIKNIKDTLQIFAKHDGSIKKCAEELFVHKNTFQYQLQKIKQLTGYDPRNYKDFVILYISCII